MDQMYVKDKAGNQVLPITHEKSVRDSNGTTLETKLQNLEGAMDKAYVAQSDNGMGRITLKKNMVGGVNTLTRLMMQATNTIYVIRYDFTLGEDIPVPANCVLEFEGGSISASGSNDTITGNNTGIISSSKCFSGVVFDGSFAVDSFNVRWIAYTSHSELQTLINYLIVNDIALDLDGTSVTISQAINISKQKRMPDKLFEIRNGSIIVAVDGIFHHTLYNPSDPRPVLRGFKLNGISFYNGTNSTVWLFRECSLIDVRIENCHFNDVNLIYDSDSTIVRDEYGVRPRIQSWYIYNNYAQGCHGNFISVPFATDFKFTKNQVDIEPLPGESLTCIPITISYGSTGAFITNNLFQDVKKAIVIAYPISTIINDNYFEHFDINECVIECIEGGVSGVGHNLIIDNNYFDGITVPSDEQEPVHPIRSYIKIWKCTFVSINGNNFYLTNDSLRIYTVAYPAETYISCDRINADGSFPNQTSGDYRAMRSLNLSNKGLQYFDTTNNRPLFWNGSRFVDGIGNEGIGYCSYLELKVGDNTIPDTHIIYEGTANDPSDTYVRGGLLIVNELNGDQESYVFSIGSKRYGPTITELSGRTPTSFTIQRVSENNVRKISMTCIASGSARAYSYRFIQV